jgi:hypothetical protein
MLHRQLGRVRKDRVDEMVNQSLLTPETDSTPRVARRVYCTENPHIRLADGTPLHLAWVIEDTDGKLYTVRSEPGGWLKRTPYEGSLEGMKLVTSEKAETIMWLTYADTDGADNVSARDRGGRIGSVGPEYRGDALDRWAY